MSSRDKGTETPFEIALNLAYNVSLIQIQRGLKFLTFWSCGLALKGLPVHLINLKGDGFTSNLHCVLGELVVDSFYEWMRLTSFCITFCILCMSKLCALVPFKSVKQMVKTYSTLAAVPSICSVCMFLNGLVFAPICYMESGWPCLMSLNLWSLNFVWSCHPRR